MTIKDLNGLNGAILNGVRLKPKESRPDQPAARLFLGVADLVAHCFAGDGR